MQERARAVCLAAYFAVQVAVPLWLMVQPVAETPKDFSWDMFSYRLNCPRFAAKAKLPDGRVEALRLERAFSEGAHLRRLLYRGRLQDYARHLCEALAVRHGGRVEVNMSVECQYDRDGPIVALTDESLDYCQAL